MVCGRIDAYKLQGRIAEANKLPPLETLPPEIKDLLTEIIERKDNGMDMNMGNHLPGHRRDM